LLRSVKKDLALFIRTTKALESTFDPFPVGRAARLLYGIQMNQSDDTILEALLRIQEADWRQYGDSPIPVALDADLRLIVEHISQLDEIGRREFLSLLSEDHANTLARYAERMAAQAIRYCNAEYIREGLKALAIVYGVGDPRDVLACINLLYHSAKKIGQDPKTVFDSIRLPNLDCEQLVRELFDNKKRDWSISVMGYVETTDQDGFRYRSGL
jgi:hypothetical protein